MMKMLCSMRMLGRASLAAVCLFSGSAAQAQVGDAQVVILDVPDYHWYAGCFGTSSGNLMGFWDRNGLPDFYTGPTGDGVAPLDDLGANVNIRSMWASKAGVDGRPLDQPGHIDDYWAFYHDDVNYSYEHTGIDPYILAGRPEHPPDCIGDFIGLSQRRWSNMNGECDGNIDAYAFVYWDLQGGRRTNFMPPAEAGMPQRDLPSGLRAWARYRGYDADVFSQLTDFNPNKPAGTGFTFNDLKAEIDAGYPVLVFMQSDRRNFRALEGMPKGNPDIHGMLIHGYTDDPQFGAKLAYYRTSWGNGYGIRPWNNRIWEAALPVRGVVGFHPKPKVRSVRREGDTVTIRWDGPSAVVYREATQSAQIVHRYRLERSTSFPPTANTFAPIGATTTERTLSIPVEAGLGAFFRVRLLGPNE